MTARRAELDHSARRNVEAHQESSALPTVVRGVAHEFNNILGVIMAYSDLIGFDLNHPDQVASHLGAIRQATARARDLTQHLLAFSQQLAPERLLLSLATTVRGAVESIQATLPPSLTIETNIRETAPIVLGVASQIGEVVVQLIRNSAQAIDAAGGQITVGLQPVEVGALAVPSEANLPPGRYAKLSVIDDGCGIDEDVRPRIFEPFFTTRNAHLGLGLTLVRGILSEHTARIMVDRRPGGGTSFTIYFPEGSAQPGGEH